ncbi:MAG: hypothetical protein ABI661_05445 [Gammaproteobacteria bacterium]
MYAVLTRLTGPALLAVLLCAAASEAAGAEPDKRPDRGQDRTAGPPLVADQPMADSEPCTEPGSDKTAMVDRVQRGVYNTVCGAAIWFDGLFGNPRYDQDSDETFGRIGVFETYDRRDGANTRLRLRARYAFPALKQRLRLTLGRGDEQELVEERPANTENPLPATFQSVNDDAWLLGLGYSKQSDLDQGFGIGVRLQSRLDPYVKATYRYNWIFDNTNMLRFRETPFWRRTRGFGTTTQVTLDRLVAPQLLLRWNNNATIAQDTSGFEWGSNVSAYQSFDPGRAISYTALLRGETSADVRIQNYGVETRYRQRMFRKWLFLELSGSLTWPRATLEEQRQINPGVGLGFEMYFGPVPEVEMN